MTLDNNPSRLRKRIKELEGEAGRERSRAIDAIGDKMQLEQQYEKLQTNFNILAGHKFTEIFNTYEECVNQK